MTIAKTIALEVWYQGDNLGRNAKYFAAGLFQADKAENSGRLKTVFFTRLLLTSSENDWYPWLRSAVRKDWEEIPPHGENTDWTVEAAGRKALVREVRARMSRDGWAPAYRSPIVLGDIGDAERPMRLLLAPRDANTQATPTPTPEAVSGPPRFDAGSFVERMKRRKVETALSGGLADLWQEADAAGMRVYRAARKPGSTQIARVKVVGRNSVGPSMGSPEDYYGWVVYAGDGESVIVADVGDDPPASGTVTVWYLNDESDDIPVGITKH